LMDLTKHLTTRADDGHASPVTKFNKRTQSTACAGPRQFLYVLVLRPYSTGGILNALASLLKGSIPPTASIHSLRRGLPGYLIPFAPHAFVPQCQKWSSNLPTPLVFLLISTDFTPTQEIPVTSTILEFASLNNSLYG